MKLSRTFTYAVQAVLELSRAEPGQTLTCKELADRGKMPERFLLQILRSLVTKGLLRSNRGVHGGYRLNCPAEEISLLDVLEAVEGNVAFDVPRDQQGEYIHPEVAGLLEQARCRLRVELARMNVYENESSPRQAIAPTAASDASEEDDDTPNARLAVAG